MDINSFLANYDINDMFPLEGLHNDSYENYGLKESKCSVPTLVKLHKETKLLFPSYYLRWVTLSNLEQQDEELLLVLMESGSIKAFEELKKRYGTKIPKTSEEYLAIGAQRNGAAETELLTYIYEPIITKIINRVDRRYFFRGQEKEDLMQEAFLGFLKAIEVYKVERRTSFRDFSRHVIERHLGTLMNRSKNLRNKALNESFSYNMPVNTNNETTFEDLLEGTSVIPEKVSTDKETYDEIRENLTPIERKVLKHYALGLSYEEIAFILAQQTFDVLNDYVYEEIIDTIKSEEGDLHGIPLKVINAEIKKKKKSVDNTIQRIRTKGKEHLRKELGIILEVEELEEEMNTEDDFEYYYVEE